MHDIYLSCDSRKRVVRALNVSTHRTGGVEFGQEEEDVVLSRLQSTVLIAVVDNLVAQREGWGHVAGFKAGGDVRLLHVYLAQLSCCARMSLLHVPVPQQLRRDREGKIYRTTEVPIHPVKIFLSSFILILPLVWSQWDICWLWAQIKMEWVICFGEEKGGEKTMKERIIQ